MARGMFHCPEEQRAIGQAVAEARKSGVPWKILAAIAGMTPQHLRRLVKAALRRGNQPSAAHRKAAREMFHQAR